MRRPVNSGARLALSFFAGSSLHSAPCESFLADSARRRLRRWHACAKVIRHIERFHDIPLSLCTR